MSLQYVFPAAKPLRDAILDGLLTLSGLALAVFIWLHSFLVSSVVFSQRWMDGIADFLEGTGLAMAGGVAVFALFMGHFLVAARKIPFRAEAQETLWAHSRMLQHQDTWLWVVQAVTGMLILIMGSIHLWVTLNDFPVLASKSLGRVQAGAWGLFYFILVVAVQTHLYIGLYRAIIKWGTVAGAKRSLVKKVLLAVYAFFLLEGISAVWYLASAHPVVE